MAQEGHERGNKSRTDNGKLKTEGIKSIADVSVCKQDWRHLGSAGECGSVDSQVVGLQRVSPDRRSGPAHCMRVGRVQAGFFLITCQHANGEGGACKAPRREDTTTSWFDLASQAWIYSCIPKKRSLDSALQTRESSVAVVYFLLSETKHEAMFDSEAPVPEVKVFKMSLNMVGFTSSSQRCKGLDLEFLWEQFLAQKQYFMIY